MPPTGGDRGEGRRLRVVVDGGRSLLDRVFDSLSHPRRRCVLYYLRDQETVAVDDLAATVAAWERGVPEEAVSEETTRRVHADLRHVHLPKLERNGLLEYDSRSGTVRYGVQPDALDEFLDAVIGFEEPP